jgi:hypothetical protein
MKERDTGDTIDRQLNNVFAIARYPLRLKGEGFRNFEAGEEERRSQNN